MQQILTFFTFCFGAIIGSFLNVVILRLPKEQSLGGRSRCAACGHNLGVWDLFPVFSYLFLLGKCRYCGRKISPRYLLIELACGILFAWAFYLLNPGPSFSGALVLLQWLVVIAVCLVTFVVDLERLIILFNVILPAAAFVCVLNLITDILAGRPLLSLSSHFVLGLFGAVAGILPFWLLWYASKWWAGEAGKWMGFGDVVLGLCLGAMLGWPLIGVAMFLGIILGGVVSVFLLAFAGKTIKSQVPFGTFLSLGAILALFYGEKLLSWYLSILGF